ncbi:Alginate-lyase domain-containing protein [Mycena sanguinolenta]|uniref:Alginate-lyase domain-containing protein n=1 Tax=Mycena sanguinolenta TaxID=230812 RepID=A0A8H6XZ76_9AGAR|nr:Alginate-lyase domain-containing protein [Mycena sanguinolenta]
MSVSLRKIGQTHVSAIGFGTGAISGFYGAIESEEERFKLLDAAHAKGCTFWDTAHVYGDSEELIGKWFKRTGKRNDIVLATKFGVHATGVRGDPAFVKEQCATSLARLGVDSIDLYYQHRVDPDVPIEITVGAMAELVDQGKVKHLGLSECSAKTLRRAHAVHPIAAVQVEYSPFVLDIEDPKIALLETARELGVTIVAYSPLGRGLLTGRFKSPDDFEADDFRRTVPKFSAENFPKILDVVSRLHKIGEKHGATAGQVTLAWILAQGPDFVVIPGTKNIKYLEENLAASAVELSKEDVAVSTRVEMTKTHSFTHALFAAGYVLLSLVAPIQSATPNTVVLDSSRLVTAKMDLPFDKFLKKTLASLTAQADSWLTMGPWSVTNKTILPPGGDLHDYASQAPYFWPSNTSNGCPYVERDGVHNPQADEYTDHNDRGNMFHTQPTQETSYAPGSSPPATRMNPNLNHAQIVPCANTGRSIGIIDFSQGYTSVLDAAAILASGAPGWSASDITAFRQWNVDFLDWLETSQFGQTETAATNNHGTFAIMQSAGIALFTGNIKLATSKANLMKSRISSYITANGSQPQELSRTRSFHYSTFDLVAYTRMAAIGKKVQVDLWGYTGAQGQSINQAVNFIIPAATNAKPWPYPELNFTAFAASDIVHASADAGNPMAASAVGNVPPPPGGDLWLLRPAVEQLDPITS